MDPSTCTRSFGPITQPFYACLTCLHSQKQLAEPEAREPNGICYACFVQCHTRHDVVELWERRGVVCECGSKKKGMPECCLGKSSYDGDEDEKAEGESVNRYNQNYLGFFCWCKEKYDFDKEEARGSVMFECIICEDWFHDRCISNIPPRISTATGLKIEEEEESFKDFICKDCVNKHPFLRLYSTVSDEQKKHGDCTVGAAERFVEALKQASPKGEMSFVECKKRKDGENSCMVDIERESKRSKIENGKEDLGALCAVKDTSANLVNNGLECKIKGKSSERECGDEYNLFCKSGWKAQLCRCSECMNLYNHNNLDFLVFEEEEDGDELELNNNYEEASTPLYDLSLRALDKMDRVKAIEGARAYNMMASKVKEALKRFAEEGRVVTKEDIEETRYRKQREEETKTNALGSWREARGPTTTPDGPTAGERRGDPNRRKET
ncbi:putative E3 ubiquitin-protein ligase ubr7 [Chytridiales sp. JEL 0842]|nr:putative E3 ubiquitin-protein ligase ubr7 [Chytridiales sp. JEL 0842]